MFRAVDKDIFKQIMKTEQTGKYGMKSIPLNSLTTDRMNAFVLDKFKEEKDFLKEIFFHETIEGNSASFV